MKNTTKITFLLFFIGALIVSAIIISSGNLYKDIQSNQVCFKKYCFWVELAQTDAERARGLMFKESLAADEGMLFIFDQEGEYPFWMKNTLIPLDIIWLDQNQKVVFISADAPPCQQENCPRINPEKEAKYVLELNAGVAFKIGLSVGDKLSFILID